MVVKLERIALTSLFLALSGKQAHRRSRKERLLSCVSEIIFATKRTQHYKMKLVFSRNWFSSWGNTDELVKITVPSSRLVICRL